MSKENENQKMLLMTDAKSVIPVIENLKKALEKAQGDLEDNKPNAALDHLIGAKYSLQQIGDYVAKLSAEREV